MGIADIFRRKPSAELVERDQGPLGLQEWANLITSFSFNTLNYTTTTQTQEEIGWQYTGLARSAYRSNGIVFACMAVRARLFSEARFMFRKLDEGRPGDLHDASGPRTPSPLNILRTPWPNGTTGDLLARMIQHVDLAGNAFVAKRQGKLACLRPDWVTILGGVPNGADDASVWHPDAEVLGYVYQEGGAGSKLEPIMLDVSEVAHFAPVPDPEARFRGMSWLTPVVREIMADKAATDHKLQFFENGATPNMLVKMDVDDLSKFQNIVREFRAQHEGATNAYKTLFLAAGADATIVGKDLQQIDFKVTQGAGETRIAAAAGIHPVIVGLSEGLQGSSLNAGNFQSARRLVADATLRPLWRNAAASLAVLVDVPVGSELWYDDCDIMFLQEDRLDAANIQQTQAATIKMLVDAGYESDSVVEAVTAGDLGLLEHTGLFSVQLQPAGTTPKQGLLQGTDVPTGNDPNEPGDTSSPAAAGENSNRAIDAKQVVEDLLASLPSTEE